MEVLPFERAAVRTHAFDIPDYLDEISAVGRLEWADKRFNNNRLVLSTSFGIQSAVLLHMVTRIRPDIPVIFIDTGYLPTETYDYVEKLYNRLFLNLKPYSAKRSPIVQEIMEGRRWEGTKEEREAFDYETKIEPMNRALKELKVEGWISGLRRSQSQRRGNLDVTEQEGNILKIYPLIDWSSKNIYDYMKQHDLPQHPLFEQGYTSVGNWFDNKPGEQRGECGIHTRLREVALG